MNQNQEKSSVEKITKTTTTKTPFNNLKNFNHLEDPYFAYSCYQISSTPFRSLIFKNNFILIYEEENASSELNLKKKHNLQKILNLKEKSTKILNHHFSFPFVHLLVSSGEGYLSDEISIFKGKIDEKGHFFSEGNWVNFDPKIWSNGVLRPFNSVEVIERCLDLASKNIFIGMRSGIFDSTKEINLIKISKKMNFQPIFNFSKESENIADDDFEEYFEVRETKIVNEESKLRLPRRGLLALIISKEDEDSYSNSSFQSGDSKDQNSSHRFIIFNKKIRKIIFQRKFDVKLDQIKIPFINQFVGVELMKFSNMTVFSSTLNLGQMKLIGMSLEDVELQEFQEESEILWSLNLRQKNLNLELFEFGVENAFFSEKEIMGDSKNDWKEVWRIVNNKYEEIFLELDLNNLTILRKILHNDYKKIRIDHKIKEIEDEKNTLKSHILKLKSQTGYNNNKIIKRDSTWEFFVTQDQRLIMNRQAYFNIGEISKSGLKFKNSINFLDKLKAGAFKNYNWDDFIILSPSKQNGLKNPFILNKKTPENWHIVKFCEEFKEILDIYEHKCQKNRRFFSARDFGDCREKMGFFKVMVWNYDLGEMEGYVFNENLELVEERVKRIEEKFKKSYGVFFLKGQKFGLISDKKTEKGKNSLKIFESDIQGKISKIGEKELINFDSKNMSYSSNENYFLLLQKKKFEAENEKLRIEIIFDLEEFDSIEVENFCLEVPSLEKSWKFRDGRLMIYCEKWGNKFIFIDFSLKISKIVETEEKIIRVIGEIEDGVILIEAEFQESLKILDLNF